MWIVLLYGIFLCSFSQIILMLYCFMKVNLIFNFSITLCEDGNRYFSECCVGVVCCDDEVLLIQCRP